MFNKGKSQMVIAMKQFLHFQFFFKEYINLRKCCVKFLLNGEYYHIQWNVIKEITEREREREHNV